MQKPLLKRYIFGIEDQKILLWQQLESSILNINFFLLNFEDVFYFFIWSL